MRGTIHSNQIHEHSIVLLLIKYLARYLEIDFLLFVQISLELQLGRINLK